MVETDACQSFPDSQVDAATAAANFERCDLLRKRQSTIVVATFVTLYLED